ncbi:hypothetical protein pEaSNUABM9_00011 [Erwinia phage pEa_SNUABM_9]|nr:hypothetical protein pEaSNUABM9_00011 [Erwinia phage pEa_SNUABM_9]
MIPRFQKIVNTHIAQAIGMPALNYDAIVTVKGKPLTIIKVHSVINSGNFANDMTGLIHMTIVLPLTQQRIATSRADGDLRVQLIVRTSNKLVGIFPYRGIAISNREQDMEAPTAFMGEAGDKAIAMVTFELMDESMWFMRTANVPVNFHDTDALTVARTILAKTMPSSGADKGEVQSLQYEEEEQQGYRDILLPDSTTFLGVFDKLQENYGIYSKGLGVYQHLRRWYLFQLYDMEKFNTAKEKLVIMNLPREMSAHIDKTIHITPGVLYLITGGDSRTLSTRDEDALNVGTGYRVGSIRALDGRSTSFTPGGVSMTTSDKFVSQANPIDYAGKIQNAPVSKDHFTDNDKPLRSKLAKTQGTLTKVTWNYSIHGLIKPGMAVKFMFANEFGMYARYGTVLGEVYQAGLDGGSIATGRYNTTTELTLWLAEQKFTA